MAYRYLAIVALMACCGIVHAQERAAAGAVDTQMTWSALSTQIGGVDNAVKAVDSKVVQIATCGKKGMVYAPGAAGADGDGCLNTVVPPSVATSLTTLLNNQTSTNATITNIITCNKAGQVYDGTKCAATASKGFTSVDLNACVYFPWIHAEQDITCPTNHVLAKMRSHKNDSQEWAGFYCCPLK